MLLLPKLHFYGKIIVFYYQVFMYYVFNWLGVIHFDVILCGYHLC